MRRPWKPWPIRLRNWRWDIKVAGYTVILDACVLYPANVRDVLLELAYGGLFRARWTKDIQREWRDALLRDYPKVTPESIAITQRNMDLAVMDAIVDGYEDLISSLDLPDSKDRHVLAAAIRCDADAIVTCNLKDFPEDQLSKYQIEPLHPDEFLVHQLGLDGDLVIFSINRIRARLKKPPMTATSYLQRLRQNGLAGFATELQQHLSAI